MSNAWRWIRVLAPITLVLPVILGCPTRPIETPVEKGVRELPQYFPQNLEKDVDLLFVIDNSQSMGEEQEKLAAQFARFIEALRNEKLGKDQPDGPPCTPQDRRNCKIPNIRIGVVSSDLGDGGLGSCSSSGPLGDGGQLQRKPRVAGCAPPTDPWISYQDGQTNIPGTVGKDQVQAVKDAFRCIAALSTEGCGYEHQLESARRALDPALNVNPGFLRPTAFLAVVFVTDEDDCSARQPALFDPTKQGLNDPLGPLTSFRCTEFGLVCDQASLRQPGPKSNCRPGKDYLHKVEDYAAFFQHVKPAGRTLLFAIAGPADPVEIGLEGARPVLKPSCTSSFQGQINTAVPALRIRSVVQSFGDKRGHFNQGLDEQGRPVDVNICSQDFAPALRLLGEAIVGSLTAQCLAAPLLTRGGALACRASDALAPGATCRRSCLELADCIIEEVVGQSTSEERTTVVERCPVDLFDHRERPAWPLPPGGVNPPGPPDPATRDCGDHCPCWRITPSAACDPARHGTPYALEILRRGEPLPGTMAVARCAGTTKKWGASELGALAQCAGD